MDNPLISVNIATYNQLPILKKIIDALGDQEFKDFEIIITDDGSSDGTKEWATEQGFNYHWQEDKGFRLAKSKNMGIAVARGKYFLSLEADVIPNYRLVSAYAKNLSPNTVILGVRHDIESVPTELDYQALDKSIVAMDWRVDRLRRLGQLEKPWRCCSGCNALFPLDKLREVGGWNEAFTHYGIDDYEVGLRMMLAGCDVMALTAAYGYHIKHDLRETVDGNVKILEDLEAIYESRNRI